MIPQKDQLFNQYLFSCLFMLQPIYSSAIFLVSNSCLYSKLLQNPRSCSYYVVTVQTSLFWIKFRVSVLVIISQVPHSFILHIDFIYHTFGACFFTDVHNNIHLIFLLMCELKLPVSSAIVCTRCEIDACVSLSCSLLQLRGHK